MAEAAQLLFCDQVFVDPSSGKATLLGIFTELRPTRFPSPFRQFAVFTMLRGEPGENGTLRCVCVSASNGKILLQFEKNLIFGLQKAIPFVLQVGEFRFPEAGSYLFELYFSGAKIATNELLLHEVS
jgi:hypothetical protein